MVIPHSPTGLRGEGIGRVFLRVFLRTSCGQPHLLSPLMHAKIVAACTCFLQGKNDAGLHPSIACSPHRCVSGFGFKFKYSYCIILRGSWLQSWAGAAVLSSCRWVGGLGNRVLVAKCTSFRQAQHSQHVRRTCMCQHAHT